jgi:hypothetical protein
LSVKRLGNDILFEFLKPIASALGIHIANIVLLENKNNEKYDYAMKNIICQFLTQNVSVADQINRILRGTSLGMSPKGTFNKFINDGNSSRLVTKLNKLSIDQQNLLIERAKLATGNNHIQAMAYFLLSIAPL